MLERDAEEIKTTRRAALQGTEIQEEGEEPSVSWGLLHGASKARVPVFSEGQ